MKVNRLLLLLAIGGALLTGCNKDDNGTDPGTGVTADGGDIKFQIGIGSQIKTKTTTGADFRSYFENGDEIGIFAVSHAAGETGTLTASGNAIHNVKLTYNATMLEWVAEAPLYYSGEQMDFYVYYPYDETMTDPTNLTFYVKTGQSTAAAYNTSDLLMAATIDVVKSSTPVTLTFHHEMALVQVEVDPAYIDRNSNFTISLRGCKTGITFNSSSATGDAQAVKMFRVERSTDANYTTKYTYRALVPAQEVAQGTSICMMEQNGQIYNTPTLATPLALTAGNAQRYTAKLPATALQTVKITHGTFTMGQTDMSLTEHQVTLTKDFYMSKYQITNAQYAAFLNANSIGSDGQWASGTYPTETLIYLSSGSSDWGLHFNTTKWEPATGKGNFPIINVTWYGAKAYADWVGGSLPTEAQWEYACRAGTTTAFWFGNNDGDMGNYGWSNENSSAGTKAVGQKTANNWGLYDMHGNVFEWCSDWYSGYTADAATDPTGAASSLDRVLRGGSWYSYAQNCRSAYRNYDNPDNAGDFIGFRVVLVP